MGLFKDKTGVKNAFLIGGMCSLSYFIVYLARNVLGVVSPDMIGSGAFTTEHIGSLSSLYFITYAIGQLINGAVGDKIKAKYMISLGLCLAGVCSILFLILSDSLYFSYLAYGLNGFFLSMIYGPMTKTVAESTEPLYATRCSLGYTVAALLGSPAAGLLAAIWTWRGVFGISSFLLLAMGTVVFFVFRIFEKKEIIRYGQYRPLKKNGGSIKLLVQNRIIKFTFVSIVIGVVRTSVVVWLPTYFAQHLGFSAEEAALLFTVSTLLVSFSAFIAILLYERVLHQNMDLTILVSFVTAAVSFLLGYFIKYAVLNVFFIILAIMSSGCAASMLWSRYCPSLRDTGMVSGATGFLDFVSYIAAAASSAIFANAVSYIGWNGLVLTWFGLMACGVFIALPYDRFLKKCTFKRPPEIELPQIVRTAQKSPPSRKY